MNVKAKVLADSDLNFVPAKSRDYSGVATVLLMILLGGIFLFTLAAFAVNMKCKPNQPSYYIGGMLMEGCR